MISVPYFLKIVGGSVVGLNGFVVEQRQVRF